MTKKGTLDSCCHSNGSMVGFLAMINVEVTKGNNENSLSVLRRFTKRVQGSGVLPRLRSIRYSERTLSENVKKKKALKRLTRYNEIQSLIRLGKPLPERRKRR